MQALGFYFFYIINWIITLLPLRVLYIFSEFLFLFAYYFPGYRRKIVAANLRNAFPEKSDVERAIIEKKFYHHFCDLIIETSKLAHMSKEQILRRMTFTNPELLEMLYKNDRDVVALLGHFNNWEWVALSIPLSTIFRIVSIYKPLQNKYFDRYMTDLRSRNGLILTPMSQIVREILNSRKNNLRSIFFFVADQTPPKSDIKYWTTFLNQETPVYLGAEKIAAKYDTAVIFANIQKIRRGYYSYTAELMFEHTAGLPDHHLTEAHVKRLEQLIRENPEYWLWSHRRWKHKREESHD